MGSELGGEAAGREVGGSSQAVRLGPLTCSQRCCSLTPRPDAESSGALAPASPNQRAESVFSLLYHSV